MQKLHQSIISSTALKSRMFRMECRHQNLIPLKEVLMGKMAAVAHFALQVDSDDSGYDSD